MATSKKSTPKKAAVKKAVAKKAAPKKVVAKKAAPKKAADKKVAVKKAPAKKVAAKKAPVKAAPAKSAPAKKAPVAAVSAWEQDPGLGSQPIGGQLIQLPVPNLAATTLPTTIKVTGTPPVAKVYASGTKEFRYWNTAAALARGSEFWSKYLVGVHWQVGQTLPATLDAGNDFNAFYDRVGLKFFHGTTAGRTVFSCDSPDVVNHEQGHAVLDSIKPQLWNAASIEADAFHESFGDMSAILCALQLKSLRIGVLAETQNMLYRSSRLSRLAEQLGWAIRQFSPTSSEPDCLRNAVNSFFYRNPHTIPSSGPASVLSSEPHSFSRVFTGAFFEGLANMFNAQAVKDEPNLLTVSQAMGKILVEGIRVAAVVPAFYSQVAAAMLHSADARYPGSGYSQALKSAFVRHGILSPAAFTTFSPAPAASSQGTGMAATHAITANALKVVEDAPVEQNEELPTMRMSIAEYGLGMDSIVVHAASEPRRFDVAGAALSLGSIVPPSQDEEAKAYLEDLLRRGRLKVDAGNNTDKKGLAISRPNEPDTHETHTHELQLDGGDYVLRRVRIACSFGACDHEHHS